jgi:hypothetical protein
MIAPDKTIVKASRGFWENMLASKIQFKGYLEVQEIDDDVVCFKSDDSEDILEAIIKLSKEHPEHKFRVKTDSKCYWNNFVKLYECKNGISKLVHEGYEYYFCTISTDRKYYDENELEKFKKKLGEFYRKIDLPSPEKIHLNIPLERCQNESEANIDGLEYVVTYTTKKSRSYIHPDG